MHSSAFVRFPAIAFGFAGLLLASCSSGPERHRGPGGTGPEAQVPPTLALVAEDTFFEGKIRVEADLGRGLTPRPSGDGSRSRSSDGEADMPSGPRLGGSGGMGGEGRRGGSRSREGGFQREGGGDSPGGQKIHESNLPPVALRLHLTNRSSELVEVTFLECKSELGDFAVRPEKLVIAPQESSEPDAMISRLGGASSELSLVVSLRVAGHKEKKTLLLHLVEPAVLPQSIPDKP